MSVVRTLKNLGFSDKEISVYTTLLRSGPSSVRRLADAAGVNRGTTYDILKSLRGQGLASFYHKATRQYFAAENPERLSLLLEKKQQLLDESKKELLAAIQELSSQHRHDVSQPKVKYLEGYPGIKSVLTDVLDTMDKADGQKEYYVYSSAGIRDYLYHDFPNYSQERIKRKISVKIIALGEGGSLQGLDERRWLTQSQGAPTYTIIYDNKTAYISVSAKKAPLGIIIEDTGLAQTQEILFEHLWKTLK